MKKLYLRFIYSDPSYKDSDWYRVTFTRYKGRWQHFALGRWWDLYPCHKIRNRAELIDDLKKHGYTLEQ